MQHNEKDKGKAGIRERAIKDAVEEIMLGFSQKYIDALENTFSHYGIWKREYSVGSLQDCATCMIFCYDRWGIFFCERNSRIELERFDDVDISNACLEMIRRVSEEKDNILEMQEYYHSLLEQNSNLGFGSKDIEETLEKMLLRIQEAERGDERK